MMTEVDDLLADLMSYSPTEKGEFRPIRPVIRPCKNGLNNTFSPNSPLSPNENLNDVDIEKIRTWLFKIGEPENDHFLVIDKCKRDPQALVYFLRHANGEYESSYSVTTETDVDDRVRCSDCKFLYVGHCLQWRKTNPANPRYKPEQLTLKRCAHFKQK
ncbi:hypothetical protein C8R30_1535 [Nitrosomonas nitrosa]|uniref:hypothetical protein n=1 Tax=Nitrosomonas nitrosa TaxID=52442 RepID=UPI000D2FD423|nr:hypothetical protein [Nitrosomonas nitrosa]PTQ88348.1 hypothetical protein C8R30_1535 [Nitrosomonas nitrosa]